MAVLVVPCPGCQTTLKAPENMVGKKAKCKKCGESFRIPGGDASGDTASDGELLSAMDLPIPPAPPPKKSATLPKPEPRVEPKGTPLPTRSKAPPPKPPARKSKDDVPMAARLDDDVPEIKPLSLSDDEEVPTVKPAASADPFAFNAETPPPVKTKAKDEAPPKAAPSGDPFSFGSEPAEALPEKSKKKSRSSLHEDDEPRSRKQKDEPEPAAKRDYRNKSGGGIGKLIIGFAVFGIVVGGVVGGVIIYLNSTKAPEQVSNDKKDDQKKVDPPVEPPPSKGTDATSKAGEKNITPKKDPPPKKTPGTQQASGGMLKLEPGHNLQFLPLAMKRETVQEPSTKLAIVPNLPAKSDSAFAMARKVFPPLKAQIDIGVLWQTEAGYQGRGEKLFLGIYSPQTGKQANQVLIDGDGSAEPACDLSVSADRFVHAHAGDSKINVWDTRTGMKVIDSFNPYTAKPDLKIAAVYLTEPPDAIITVSTTGAVHAFKVPSKEPIAGEFIPAKTSAKPLVPGKSIAIGPGRQSVVLVVGGTIFAVNVSPTVTLGATPIDVGEVSRSLGLATSGSKKILYAFETDVDGKKERAVMEVRGPGIDVFYRWPDKDAGEPVVAGWVGDDLAMIGTDRGSCVWFESEGKAFNGVGLAQTPNGKARHVASDGHWTLLPDPADPKKCVLVEFSKPQSAITGVLESTKQLPTVQLTDKGLFK